MWKAALIMFGLAVGVGAMMPARPAAEPDSASANQSIMVSPAEPAAASPFRQSSLGGTVSLPRQGDGHFYASAEVNGSTIEFVVDTGATVVSLTRADAERAGLTIDPDKFEVVAQGASGPVMGLPVILHDVSLGGHRLDDVPALVLADGGQSLLGQNVLSKFQSVSIENDEMLLR